MTFNATPIHVGILLAAGLVERPPLRGFSTRVRRLYVTKDIDGFLNANEPFFPRASFESQLSIFGAGHLVTVSRARGDKQADLKQVVGVNEVWSFCFRRPRPGGRLLGRFLDENIFVGTELKDRHDLGGKEYRIAAENVASKWMVTTGNAPFVSSSDLSAYLGQTNYRDLDDDDD